MQYRSTAARGYVHFGGELVTGVGPDTNAFGVQLTPGSTASTAWVESVSDDTNANIGMRAKGAGTVTLGVSSNGVRVNGSSFNITSTQVRVGSTASSIVIGNSTTFLTGIQRVSVALNPPALSSFAASDETPSTDASFTTSANYIFTPRIAYSTEYAIGMPYCSTAGDLRIRFHNISASTFGTGESTNSGTVLVFRY